MTPRMFYTLARVLAALTVIPFHEAGHALAAWLLGDPTAKQQGRLSLNPFRPKQGMALTALAGPVANLILAYLAMVVWKLLYYWAPVNDATIFLALFLQYLVYLDVSLAVFNLIPVHPLDGSRVVDAFLPFSWSLRLQRYQNIILLVFIAALWFGWLDGLMSLAGNAMLHLAARCVGLFIP